MVESPTTTATPPEPTPLRPAVGLNRAAILSVGTALPAGRLTTAELATQLGVSEDWIVSPHRDPRAPPGRAR